MWTWDGVTWTRHATAGPAPGPRSTMAYDPALGGILLLGGSRCGGEYVAETWAWSGSAWTQLHPGGTTPSVDTVGGLAYDPGDRSMVFADEGSSLWRYDGQQWSRMASLGPDAPPARTAAVIVSPGPGRWLVYGGGTGVGGFNDTWTFDGRSWSRRIVPVAPPPRAAAAAAYDPALRRVVVFGGIAGGYGAAMLNDTWTWDGTAWAMA